MYFKTFFSFIFFITILTTSLGDEEADLTLRKSFEELEGDMAVVRDHCLQNNSVKVSDLKDYSDADDVPERDLCFYKCFYEAIGVINNGKFVVELIKTLPGVQSFGEDQIQKLIQCIQGLDDIGTCSDLRKAEACFNTVSM